MCMVDKGHLRAAQNKCMYRNYINTIIGKTQTSNCSLSGSRTINHMNKCSKLAQEYDKIHDRVGMRKHYELCKLFGFYHAVKLYMGQGETVLENRKCQILLYLCNTLHMLSSTYHMKKIEGQEIWSSYHEQIQKKFIRL